MAEDRVVAGLRCMEVLALLDAFVDGGLSEAQRSQVEAHLAGCDWCTKFGGEYAGLVTRLKGLTPSASSSSDEVAEALARKLLNGGG